MVLISCFPWQAQEMNDIWPVRDCNRRAVSSDIGAARRQAAFTRAPAKGHTTSWIGYKLHLDVADGDIPFSAVLTSASLHDSQVAIPLATMTASRVTNLYDLMDSAMTCPISRPRATPSVTCRSSTGIHAACRVARRRLRPRRGASARPATCSPRTYNERSAAERVTGGVRSNSPKSCHLRKNQVRRVLSASTRVRNTPRVHIGPTVLQAV